MKPGRGDVLVAQDSRGAPGKKLLEQMQTLLRIEEVRSITDAVMTTIKVKFFSGSAAICRNTNKPVNEVGVG